MSIKLMSMVWSMEAIPSTNKLVLLALCDYANDQGESCFPSIKGIAAKSSLSERQTQRIMHQLIRLGIVRVSAWEKGGRNHTRHYTINVHKIKGDNMSPNGIKGDIRDIERVTSCPIKGDTHVTRTINESLNDPSDRMDDNKIHSKKEKFTPRLVSLNAINEVTKLANANGVAGGGEIGIELENIFLGWVKEEPRAPDAAFKTWATKYIHKHAH